MSHFTQGPDRSGAEGVFRARNSSAGFGRQRFSFIEMEKGIEKEEEEEEEEKRERKRQGEKSSTQRSLLITHLNRLFFFLAPLALSLHINSVLAGYRLRHRSMGWKFFPLLFSIDPPLQRLSLFLNFLPRDRSPMHTAWINLISCTAQLKRVIIFYVFLLLDICIYRSTPQPQDRHGEEELGETFYIWWCRMNNYEHGIEIVAVLQSWL